MRILVIDKFFQPRDPAMMDMYALISEVHTLITDNFMQHLLAKDYDILWLGIYHHRMEIDWHQVMMLNNCPLIIDQADNEEFIADDKLYFSLSTVTVLSRYLPNDLLQAHCAKYNYELKFLPWFINAGRLPLRHKFFDVVFICSIYGDREILQHEIIKVCKKKAFKLITGEYWGTKYMDMMAISRVTIAECSRRCVTQKYIEASLTGTAIIGDVPIYPANDLHVIPMDRTMLAQNITEALTTETEHNRAYVLDTFASRQYFINHLNKII